MSKALIPAFSKRDKPLEPKGKEFLNVSEFYYDTIQGEGIYRGYPAAFLRLRGCILDCVYCDTAEVWRSGHPYSFSELFGLIEESKLIYKLLDNQHLIFTGGSPLLQQDRIQLFLEAFWKRFGFFPFIEIENECVINPNDFLTRVVRCWNNSPKLENSGESMSKRYKPYVIKRVAGLPGWNPNSWFKFVIGSEKDWEEIQSNFLDTELINKNQIILMPLGESQEEIRNSQQAVVELAIKHNVIYSSRDHIVLWDKKVSV
jgi:7-carboxy-7-deazaguanine synthase